MLRNVVQTSLVNNVLVQGCLFCKLFTKIFENQINFQKSLQINFLSDKI